SSPPGRGTFRRRCGFSRVRAAAGAASSTSTRRLAPSSGRTFGPGRWPSPRSRSAPVLTGSPFRTAERSAWDRAWSRSCFEPVLAGVPERGDRRRRDLRQDVASGVEERAPHDGTGPLPEPAEEERGEEDRQAGGPEDGEVPHGEQCSGEEERRADHHAGEPGARGPDPLETRL